MQAVMISIKPKWVRLIASGQKTVEVRKTRPKIDVPFKCYIYETQGRKWKNKNEPQMQEGNGRVVGEFVCDICAEFTQDYYELSLVETGSCVPMEDLKEYIGKANDTAWCWHISDLKMYDKPKELSEFCNGSSYLTIGENDKLTYTGMTRAPQSWCYVEELS